MKSLIFVTFFALECMLSPLAHAVTEAEDIATTIMLSGYTCGGREVSDIAETQDDVGNKTITATCPNGRRYRIDVSHDGRVVITPIQ